MSTISTALYINIKHRQSFVRSGDIYMTTNSIRHVGINGDYWSSTATPIYNTGATKLTGYDLYFHADGINSSAGPYDRWFGFPIRCLAY